MQKENVPSADGAPHIPRAQATGFYGAIDKEAHITSCALLLAQSKRKGKL